MLNRFDKSQKRDLLSALSGRAEKTPSDILATVDEVIENVRRNGDSALREYSKKFDGVDRDKLLLSEDEKKSALAKVPAKLAETIERAAENIYAFHERQKEQSWVDYQPGKVMGQRIMPLSSVGLYVPGGSAAYPSTVLMNAIPAKVAGVKKIVMVTPPKGGGINPAVIKAAEIAGVTDIYAVGGAQAVAALAYGTETVPKVDKIVGPGNIFVATAKRLVFGTVDIDMIAGPSEVLVIADDKSDPAYIAADLMAQAEHDPMAAAVLITTSSDTADKVDAEIERQIKRLDRAEIINKSLSKYGFSIVVDSLEEALELSDLIAPEHLELAVENPFSLLGLVHNAGSVFMGENSPEPLGDYYAGPNHVLPTNGTARFSSALSVNSFVKRSSYLYYDREQLCGVKEDVIRFAESEGLDAHANSVRVRFEK